MKSFLLLLSLITCTVLSNAQTASQSEIDNWVKRADDALQSNSYNTAFNLFEKAADAGDGYALYRIGWIYSNGKGRTKNYERAAEWYQKAVEAGNARAMNGLGYLYDHGYGVEQNFERAFQLFKQSVAAGYDVPLYNIGYYYESGRAGTKDLQKAVLHYRLAAEKEYVSAMNKMASFYRSGTGVEKDLKQAAEWYQKAADKGNANAMYHLAELYQSGTGVKKDIEKARTLYQQASGKGHSDAKKALVSMNIIAEQKQQVPGGLKFSADGHINGYNSNVRFITYSQNGKYMVTASDDFKAIIWDAASGKLMRSLHTGSEVRHAVFSPDGKRVATSSLQNAIIVWDRATGTRLLEITTGSEPSSVSYSPDSKRIVTLTWHGHPEVWDIASQKYLFQLKGHTKSISQAVYSHDGKYIATVSVDKNTILWDANTGERLQTMRGAEEPPEGYTDYALETVSPCFSPDDKKIAFGSGYLTKICNVANGETLHVLQGNDFIHSVAFSPDGKTVVTGSKNVKVWNVNSGKLVRTLALEKPNGVCFSPDGKIIAGYTDDFIVLWDAASGTQLRKIKVDGGYLKNVFSLAFSPDGATISAGTDIGGQLWDTHSGKKIRNLGGRERKINAVFIPGTNTLAFSAERQTKIFDAATDKLLFSLKGDFYAFSPDGKTLVTVMDSTAYLWDAATGSLRHTLAGHSGSIKIITFDPLNQTVAASPESGGSEIWDVATGKLLTTLKTYSDYETRQIAFSPDGKQVITTGEGFFSAVVWNAKTGENVFNLKSDYKADMGSGDFTPDGKNIITVTLIAGQVIKWNAKTGERISIINKEEGQHNAKFGSFNDYSPDGKKMVIHFTLHKKNSSGNNKKINKVFDIQTGKPLFTLEGESNRVEYSPDGKYLFGFDSRGKIAKIWDANTGKLLHTLRDHQYNINGITCSPDSKYIMTTALNGSLILWDAATGKRILKQFIYDNFERVTVANNGLIDATPGAKKKVYGVRDSGIAAYEQLSKEGYEEPNLWAKIIRGEKLREVAQ